MLVTCFCQITLEVYHELRHVRGDGGFEEAPGEVEVAERDKGEGGVGAGV